MCFLQIENFGNVFSNLLESSNQHGWNDIQMNDPAMGSELLLQNAESFGSILTARLSNSTEIQDLVISAPNIGITNNILYISRLVMLSC